MVITIDGPVASGKSTASRRLAQRLGYFYLYSGMIYRALAYILSDRYGYAVDQIKDPLEKDVRDVLDPARFIYRYDDQYGVCIFYDGADVTPFLKGSFIDKLVSEVAMNANVRLLIRRLQHQLAAEHDLVAEGRDMGTVVFPDADFKFFLTASHEVRAQRWQRMQRKRGTEFSIDEAKKRVEERDQRDCARSIAPLCVPVGAIIVDNSGLTVDEVIDRMLQEIRQCNADESTG